MSQISVKTKIKTLIALLTLNTVLFAGYVKNPQRVLIIGNSLTFYNNGVDASLNNLYNAAGNATFHAERVANSGWTLAQHFASTASITKIKQGYNGKPWDVVVLQGLSNEPSDVALRPAFYKAVKQLDSVITSVKSNTYLELTWSYLSVTDNTMFNNLVKGYDSASSLIGHAPIIPAGYAFMNLRNQFNIYADDKHPNENATYLIANTFYGFFAEKSPVGLSWVLTNVPANNVNKIQTTAWDAVLAHPYSPITSIANNNPCMSGSCGEIKFANNVFDFSAPVGSQYTVISVSGKIVKSGSLHTTFEAIDLNAMPKGMYLINTKIQGKIATTKVIIK